MLIDLMNGITITSDMIKLNNQYKVYFENNLAVIELKDQDHTVGNLITDYLKRLKLDHILNFEDNKNIYYIKQMIHY